MFEGRRNVLILAVSQALMLSAIVLAVALGAILGNLLAPDRSLATLPLALMVIGTAAASIPASAIMRWRGRRAGFLLGTSLGIAGSALCALALQRQSFVAFAIGHLLLGGYQGFASYYRFAAVEATDADHGSLAISLVVAGGIVAAFLGPQLALRGRDWVAGEPFVGSYLAQGMLSALGLLLLTRLHMRRPTGTLGGAARPLRTILAQPAARVAILGAAVGAAVMTMIMTATPLAMLGCGLPGTDVTLVIEWHVVGMFAPSFATGSLIRRYGAPRIMQVGFVLLLAHVAVALAGIELLHFFSALVLLGVGWNFAFIGGTALLTETYRPGEQLRVQAANEFVVFGLVAIATLCAGWLYNAHGWVALNLAVVPFLVVALGAALRVRRHHPVGGT
jgi:MFS family permease